MEYMDFTKKQGIAGFMNFWWILLCFVPVLFFGCSPSGKANSEAKYREGFSLYLQGRYLEAATAYKEAIRINPNNALAYNDLGTIYSKVGHHREAIEFYKQSIRIKADYYGAHYNLGLSYSELGRWQEAINAYKQALRLNPKNVDVQYSLGVAYLETKDKSAVSKILNILKNLDSEKAKEFSSLVNQYASVDTKAKTTAESRVEENDGTKKSEYSIAVLKVKDPAPRNTYFYPKKGGRLIAVEIVIGNVAGGKIAVNPLDAILVDTEGFLYTPVLGVSGQLDSGVYLNSGEKVKGWVGFEIPLQAKPQGIKYKTDSSGSTTVEAELGEAANVLNEKEKGVSNTDEENGDRAIMSPETRSSPRNICKLEGVSIDNNWPNVFISCDGKAAPVKIGDRVCDGELIKIYAPHEPDGITPNNSVNQYEYRIKIRTGQEEKVFKNGDVICGDSSGASEETTMPKESSGGIIESCGLK